MKLSAWRGLTVLLILVMFFFGCTVPPSAAEPPLTVAAAQATLDGWNPSYCKVTEFYGIHKPEAAGTTRVAYVNLVNPNDKTPKLVVYAGAFQLLTLADGKQQWFLTSLLTHGQGLFAKRQGWDNLMIPVKEAGAGNKK